MEEKKKRLMLSSHKKKLIKARKKVVELISRIRSFLEVWQDIYNS